MRRQDPYSIPERLVLRINFVLISYNKKDFVFNQGFHFVTKNYPTHCDNRKLRPINLGTEDGLFKIITENQQNVPFFIDYVFYRLSVNVHGI